MTASSIIFVCWLILIFYWIINWRNVKSTQEVKREFWFFPWVIAGSVIAVTFLSKRLGGLPSCFIDWTGCHYHTLVLPSVSLVVQVIAAIITIIGLIVAIYARRTLAGNWSSTLDLKCGHELITTGIYRYVRHPIYSGALLMGLGTVVEFQSLNIMLLFIIIFVLFMFRMKKEEELMMKTFSKKYPDYKKRVKAIIPYIF